MSPFLYGLAINRGRLSNSFEILWYGNKLNRAPLISLIIFRAFLAVIFLMALLLRYFEFSYWALLILFLAGGLFYFISRYDILKFAKMEKLFFENFNQKDEHQRRIAPITTSVKKKMANRDIHLENILVSSNCMYAGMKLKDIPFRSEFGVNIVKIKRGKKEIPIPTAEDYIYPGDKILALGTDSQIAAFMNVMSNFDDDDAEDTTNVGVYSFKLSDKSYLTNMTIQMARTRDSGCLIIGIDRANNSITNPNPDFIFQAGDIVWMVGEKEKCEWFF